MIGANVAANSLMKTMTEHELIIAYKEGSGAYYDDVTSILYNPYDGVSRVLAKEWEQGWWDAWYSEEDND